MFNIIVKKNYDEVSDAAFEEMKKVLNEKNDPILGLATGSTPVGLYQRMVKDHQDHGTSYKDILTFNLDEYYGLPHTHEQSYWTFMHENLFNYLDIPEENIHVPSGEGDDPDRNAEEYEKALSAHTVDIQILGIGSDGHIAFNEPGTPFDSLTHVADLKESTIHDNARFFGGNEDLVPKKAVTQGLADIMRARRIVLLASGANKADAVAAMVHGKADPSCPASILQNHDNVVVILDEAAASKLQLK